MKSRLRDLREDRDLTQKELADVLGVHQTTYSSYEIGKLCLTSDVLVKLAKYYKVSIDYLVGITDVPEPYPERKRK